MRRGAARREKMNRGRSLALAIHPGILQIRARLDSLRQTDADRYIHRLLHHPDPAAQLGLPVTELLRTSFDSYHFMGTRAGADAPQLVALAIQYNEMLLVSADRIRSAAGDEIAPLFKALRDLRDYIPVCCWLESEPGEMDW